MMERKGGVGMTELEIMQRAKMYMDQLSQGVDPISGRRLPAGSGLDQQRLSKCFAYVSGVLQKVIENGGTVGSREKEKYIEFALTQQQRASVLLWEYPVRITDWIDALYKAAENPQMKRISAGRITDWLVMGGFLDKQTGPDGKTFRIPTEQGTALGLTVEQRQGRDGQYLTVYYSPNAQRYLLQHLDEILQWKKEV